VTAPTWISSKRRPRCGRGLLREQPVIDRLVLLLGSVIAARQRVMVEVNVDAALRATWPEQTLTGEELLRRCREHGPHLTEAELDRVAETKRSDRPPEDKWAAP